MPKSHSLIFKVIITNNNSRHNSSIIICFSTDFLPTFVRKVKAKCLLLGTIFMLFWPSVYRPGWFGSGTTNILWTKLGNWWVIASVWVLFVLIFAVVQLCTAEYVIYGRKRTLDDNLSLDPNRCHHPLITQLTGDWGGGWPVNKTPYIVRVQVSQQQKSVSSKPKWVEF